MNKHSVSLAATLLATASLSATAQAAEYEVTIENLSAAMYFTPVIVAAHSPATLMFATGHAASAELQNMAESGNVGPLATLFEGMGASVATGDGLVGPGATVSLTVTGSAENSVLSLSAMILPSNDGFVGLSAIALPGGSAGYSKTYYALGYDAGTEANDELIGTGAVGEAGFPAPPPIVASGTGTGGAGIQGRVEGFVSVHKGTLGDLDDTGGPSDINAAVHGWLNPIARVTVTRVGGDDDSGGNGSGPGAVPSLTGQVYSSTAVEVFWQAASSADSTVVSYDIRRDGELLDTRDALSFYESDLSANTAYAYSVSAVDANGNRGEEASVTLTTNEF